MILQFNDASITTVGVLGVMFALVSGQTLVIATVPDSSGVPMGARWVSGAFSVLFAFAGIWALMEGTIDIVRALEIRRIHEEL